MNRPWDAPDFPPTITDQVEPIYCGVGRVLTSWEGIEEQLSRLYSFASGRPDERETIAKYGSERIFVNRLHKLKMEASALFSKIHSQEIEGEFDSIVELLIGFSGRRNEVAHGIVRPIQIYTAFATLQDFRPRTNYWALVPPSYQWKGHSINAMPPYAYGAHELCILSENVEKLYGSICSFREKFRLFLDSK
jgi:hypothetical protein